MRMTDELRERCLPVWSALHEHPFLRELAEGTLPPESFRFYVEQNLMYLPEYARAIAVGAARSRDLPELRSFTAALDNIVRVEIPENEARLREIVALGAQDGGGALAMAPRNVAYTGFLTATAFRGGPLDVMTAIMPCAWSYGDIAAALPRAGADAHPVYGAWIGFFASEEYAQLVERMRGELDDLAAREGAAVEDLEPTFTMGARLELGFWDMAYSLEQWPDLAVAAETG
jgi:thiaminase (transcriptional activator TenA)